MKLITLLVICVFLLNSCKMKNEEQVDSKPKVESVNYKSFGKMISAEKAQAGSSLASAFQTLQVGDSIDAKFLAKVNEVCQAKGCWMRLSVDANEVMVKFKDYGFFVPKGISGKDVIVSGKAYVKEVSIDEQRHYAEDAGKSKEDIAKITQVKKTYSFEAEGVLVAQ